MPVSVLPPEAREPMESSNDERECDGSISDGVEEDVDPAPSDSISPSPPNSSPHSEPLVRPTSTTTPMTTAPSTITSTTTSPLPNSHTTNPNRTKKDFSVARLVGTTQSDTNSTEDSPPTITNAQIQSTSVASPFPPLGSTPPQPSSTAIINCSSPGMTPPPPPTLPNPDVVGPARNQWRHTRYHPWIYLQR